MILVLDNVDSFTYNLVQLLGTLTARVEVRRNNAVTADEVLRLRPEGIVVSPGPGRPEGAGATMEIIRRCGQSIPILGVCLGHQAIGAVFGASIVHAPSLMHGRTSEVFHTGTPLYRGVGNPFVATRYHSLVISPDSVPPDLEITAHTADGVIMGVRHTTYPIQGVQFHPESILTADGLHILRNWLPVRP